MLSTVVIVFLTRWLLGIQTSYTLGGLIHTFQMVAIIVVLVRIIQGRSPLGSHHPCGYAARAVTVSS